MKVTVQKSISYPSNIVFDEFKGFSIPQLYVRTLAMYIFKIKKHFLLWAIITRSSENAVIISQIICKSINLTSLYLLFTLHKITYYIETDWNVVHIPL